MSTTITYKGSTITTVNNQTIVLNTEGTWLEDDITLVDVSGSGNEWQSGIYQDENGYLWISPYTSAGGIEQDDDGFIWLFPDQTGFGCIGELKYLYEDANGYIHTSDTPPSGNIKKLLVVVVKREYDYTYADLVDSSDNNLVDSNGNQFIMAMT